MKKTKIKWSSWVMVFLFMIFGTLAKANGLEENLVSPLPKEINIPLIKG
ncbi:MAG: hypothetical protein GX786_00340 [Clostridiales bacterium]|nr:hypothetical protein [Clostridiales bacterium]